MNLILNCYMGYNEHPQQTMERFGITYQKAIPQSLTDQWIFLGCQNIPKLLPENFSVFECEDISKMVGFGLSKEDAKKYHSP